MIDVYIDGHSIKITGHSDTQPCARVSQTHSIMGQLLGDKATDYSNVNGYSYIKLDGLTKSEEAIFDKLADAYRDLASPSMYHRMIRIHEGGSKESTPVVMTAESPSQVDEKPKVKRGRKPTNKGVTVNG